MGAMQQNEVSMEVFSSLTKALSHTMYLLSALHVGENDWNFLVRGTSGKNYFVHFSPQRFVCECKQFNKKNRSCKHIYFIIGRVLEDRNLMFAVGTGLTPKDLFNADRHFNLSMELRLLSSLVENKERRLTKNCCFKNDGSEGDCVICTETMKNVEVWVCNQCKQALHPACVARWMEAKKEKICPLCRNKEFDDEVDEMEAMSKFQSFYNSDGVFYV